MYKRYMVIIMKREILDFSKPIPASVKKNSNTVCNIDGSNILAKHFIWEVVYLYNLHLQKGRDYNLLMNGEN